MLHGLTNSFPTRRCSVLGAGDHGGTAIPAATESPAWPSTASATTGSGSTVADSAGGYVSAAVAWLSDRDRAAFEAQAAEAAWFTVGLRDAPVLYMVVDPQCPFCHQAWERLRPLVIAKKLQIRIRSEEHTSELQSLMRISYAVFCWKKKKLI